MTHSDDPSDPTANLSAAEAFQAMRYFLEAYSKRGPQSPHDIAHLLGDIDCSFTLDGGPADPAQWGDWLQAIETVKTADRGAAP